jgi:membrane protein CcdC involved in cytochrome C biogenesis
MEIKNKIPKLVSFASYEIFILIGFLMAAGTFMKLMGFYNVSSDWFWFLAGIGLMIEGSISLVKQKRFEKKYKIVEKDE